MKITAIPSPRAAALQVKSGLRAGAIVCYDNSSGALVPVWTPCSTSGPYYPPAPAPAPTPNVQWLNCQSCTGTKLAEGQLGPAQCEVCYTK